MGRKGTISGPYRPTVLVRKDASRTAADNRLDRNDQPFVHDLARLRIGIVWDVGSFVDGASDAVSSEFANDRESRLAHFAFYHSPDLKHAEPGPRDQHGLVERPLRTDNQPLRLRADAADWHRDRGVGHVAVFLQSDIEFDEVPFPQLALARDPVHRFIVQAD